jgi:hypothetical protein
MLSSFGVIVAATYYLLMVRNTIRTRQAQLFMEIYQQYSSEDVQKTFIDLLHLEWIDIVDFERKYGSGDYPELYAKREAHFAWYDGMGVLLKKNLVDPEMVYETLGHGGAIYMWNKFGSLIKEQREIYNVPDRFTGFEYLAEEMKKMKEKKGYTVTVPESYDRYIEDT